MILIVTNKADRTADFLILELQRRGEKFMRLNTEDFPASIQLAWNINQNGLEGELSIGKQTASLSEIRSVWFRRPKKPQSSQEIVTPREKAFVVNESTTTLEGLWQCLDCFWVSRPEKLRVAEQKMYQLVIAKQVGLKISPTLITNIPQRGRDFVAAMNSDVVYKTLKSTRVGSNQELGIIFTSEVRAIPPEQYDLLAYSPALLQRKINKKVDLRITVIGNKIFAVEIKSRSLGIENDWRTVNPLRLLYTQVALPADIAAKCLNLTVRLGLSFGAIDMIQTPEGEYFFLEINPNGQWAWMQQVNPRIHLKEALADLLIGGGQP